MRCLCCYNPLKEIASDNLAIYRCPNEDCPLYRIYQAGMPESDGEDLDRLVERIIRQHIDEPPSAPSTDTIEDEPLEPSEPKFTRRVA